MWCRNGIHVVGFFQLCKVNLCISSIETHVSSCGLKIHACILWRDAWCEREWATIEINRH